MLPTATTPLTESGESSFVIDASCLTAQLWEALDAVNAACESDLGAMEIQFDSQSDKAIFFAQNFSFKIHYEVDFPHQGSGVVKIPGRQLLEYVRQLPPETIFFHAEVPYRLMIKCKGSCARMQLLCQDISSTLHQNAQIPSVYTSRCELSGRDLIRWFESFKDFLYSDDMRFYAKSALVWAEANASSDGVISSKLCAVATDSIRLAQSFLETGVHVTSGDATDAILLSKKAIEEMRKRAQNMLDEIFVLQWNSQSHTFCASCKNYTLQVQTISGLFPPYKDIIPKTAVYKTRFSLDSLKQAIKRSLILTDDDRVITLWFESDRVLLTSTKPGMKEGEESLEVLERSVPDGFQVNYQGQYLYAMLDHIHGNYVDLVWQEQDRPMFVQGEVERGLDVLYMLGATCFD